MKKTIEELEKIKVLRDVEKKSFSEIGKIFGMSRQAAYQFYLKTHANKIENRTRWSEYREEWSRMKTEGISIYAIGKKFGVSTSVVSGQLKKAGVETGEKLKRKIV